MPPPKSLLRTMLRYWRPIIRHQKWKNTYALPQTKGEVDECHWTASQFRHSVILPMGDRISVPLLPRPFGMKIVDDKIMCPRRSAAMRLAQMRVVGR